MTEARRQVALLKKVSPRRCPALGEQVKRNAMSFVTRIRRQWAVMPASERVQHCPLLRLCGATCLYPQLCWEYPFNTFGYAHVLIISVTHILSHISLVIEVYQTYFFFISRQKGSLCFLGFVNSHAYRSS